MLNTWPAAASTSAASRFAATTFEMWVKSRSCSPSPKIVGCLPFSIAVMNFGMTAE